PPPPGVAGGKAPAGLPPRDGGPGPPAPPPPPSPLPPPPPPPGSGPPPRRRRLARARARLARPWRLRMGRPRRVLPLRRLLRRSRLHRPHAGWTRRRGGALHGRHGRDELYRDRTT